MTDWNLAAKIFFGIAAGCVVLLILIVAVKELPRRIKFEEWRSPPQPWMPSPPFVMEPSKEPIQETSPANDVDTLEKRVASLETKLTQIEKRVHNTDMLDDRFIVRAFAVWGHELSATILLFIVLALISCLLSALSNIRLPLGSSLVTPTPTVKPTAFPKPTFIRSFIVEFISVDISPMIPAQPKGRFIVVTVKLTNNTSSPFDISPNTYAIIDKTHSKIIQLHPMTDLGSDVHLKPGASIIHRLLFDVTNPYDDLRLSVFNNPELSDPIPIPIPR